MIPNCSMFIRSCPRAVRSLWRVAPVAGARILVPGTIHQAARALPHCCASATRTFSAPSTGFTATPLDLNVYHRLTDTALDDLSAQLEELVETVDLDALEESRGSGATASDWDIEYAVSLY